MTEKKTQDLENILKNSYTYDFENYKKDYLENPENENHDFFVYMKALFKEKNLTQQSVFLNADIPERYGYKLLSRQKRTRQRDIILRICYGAQFSLEQTQRALEKYGMPRLYAKNERDALLMILFNRHPGSVIDANQYLMDHGMEMLRTSGVQD